mmetsp:Transcript_93142/g.263270  ORF Transcript_93142/g.263270 Transcript_93142/m.263270 type:complete len:294 (-) Transcript_93142:2805-3686(-)
MRHDGKVCRAMGGPVGTGGSTARSTWHHGRRGPCGSLREGPHAGICLHLRQGERAAGWGRTRPGPAPEGGDLGLRRADAGRGVCRGRAAARRCLQRGAAAQAPGDAKDPQATIGPACDSCKRTGPGMLCHVQSAGAVAPRCRNGTGHACGGHATAAGDADTPGCGSLFMAFHSIGRLSVPRLPGLEPVQAARVCALSDSSAPAAAGFGGPWTRLGIAHQAGTILVAGLLGHGLAPPCSQGRAPGSFDLDPHAELSGQAFRRASSPEGARVRMQTGTAMQRLQRELCAHPRRAC